MKKILIGGAGGAPSEGVIESLLLEEDGEMVIGMGSEPFDLALSAAQKKCWVPYSYDPGYKKAFFRLLAEERPDFVHFQNDREIYEVSHFRDEIAQAGIALYMPPHDVIDTCVDKYKSYLRFREAGLPVPVNRFVHSEDDLKKSFEELGDENGFIWLRSSSIGGGGKGALPTNDYDFAKGWIDRFKGWGEFIAAEMLSSKTVTWLSIWYEGELVVAQTRSRRGWEHGSRTLSGVTGVTKVGQTYSSDEVTRIAQAAVQSVSDRPHGIFGVDMTYDKRGVPNPTEINISRFFTTILFFSAAGLNMPVIFKDIALYGKFPSLDRKINPLPDGLLWCRGMDKKPRLVREEELKQEMLVYQ